MANYISDKTSKRGVFILITFVVLAFIIVFALFKLQIIEYDEYQQYVIDQMTVETNVNPSRGNIYDINGKTLATNQTVWILYLIPKNIEDPEFIAKNISEILEIDYNAVLDKAKKRGYKYQIINNSLDKAASDKIRDFIDKYSL